MWGFVSEFVIAPIIAFLILAFVFRNDDKPWKK